MNAERLRRHQAQTVTRRITRQGRHAFVPFIQHLARMQRHPCGRVPYTEFPTPGGVIHAQEAVLGVAPTNDQASGSVRMSALMA